MRFIPFLFLVIFFNLNFYMLNGDSGSGLTDPPSESVLPSAENASRIFSELKGDTGNLSFEAFRFAWTGYMRLLSDHKLIKGSILSVIDFSLPSREKRLWVIDLEKQEILFHELVAHGKNSGMQYPRKFSNMPETNMSSLGFYKTGNTYTGKHGMSLVLDGLEKDFNGNARKRAIVMHPASYVSGDYIRKYGRIGRSFGCPAIPAASSGAIINTIKDGSCLFIYFPSPEYLSGSSLLDGGSYTD